MKTSSKVIIMAVMVGIGIFGYSQYASASQIGVTITQSELLEENQYGSTHDVELQFDNPSLLVLAAGETDFFVISNEQTVGQGKLDPFVLEPMETSLVSGVFHTDSEWEYDKESPVKITGVAKYNVWFTVLEIPFVFYPDERQIMEFID